MLRMAQADAAALSPGKARPPIPSPEPSDSLDDEDGDDDDITVPSGSEKGSEGGDTAEVCDGEATFGAEELGYSWA